MRLKPAFAGPRSDGVDAQGLEEEAREVADAR